MSEVPVSLPRMAVATPAELATALARANDLAAQQELHQRVAGVLDLVWRMDAALEEQNRLAEFRVRVGQKLGRLLVEQVHPRRPRIEVTDGDF